MAVIDKILDNALVKITSQINENEGEEGSGCLFKYPNQDSKFVVLVTAKHCIYGKDDEVPIDSLNITVTYQRGEKTFSEFKIKEPPLIIEKRRDIAFYIFKESELCKNLKIKQLKLHGFEVIKRKPTEIDSICFFRGYPYIADNNAITLKGEYRSGKYRNKFTIESPSLRGKDKDIDGMSGCGVFMEIRDNTFLIGIVVEQDRFSNVHCISLASVYSNLAFKEHFKKIENQAIFDSLYTDYQGCKYAIEEAIKKDIDLCFLLPEAEQVLYKVQNFDINNLDNSQQIEVKISHETYYFRYLQYYCKLKRDFEIGQYDECLFENNNINIDNLPRQWEDNAIYTKIIDDIKDIERKSRYEIEEAKRKIQEQAEKDKKRRKKKIYIIVAVITILIGIKLCLSISNWIEESQNKFDKCIKNANFLIKNKKETYQIIAKCYEQAHLLRPDDSLRNKAIYYDSLYYQMILDQRKLGYETPHNSNPKIMREYSNVEGKQVFLVKKGHKNPKRYKKELGWYSGDTIQVPAMFSDIRKSDKKGIIEVRIIGSEKIWIEVDTSGNCLNCWEVDLK